MNSILCSFLKSGCLTFVVEIEGNFDTCDYFSKTRSLIPEDISGVKSGNVNSMQIVESFECLVQDGVWISSEVMEGPFR